MGFALPVVVTNGRFQCVADRYRIVDCVRECYCKRCDRWLVHDLRNFYVRANQFYGLRTICIKCLRAQQRPFSDARTRRVLANEKAQLAYARAARERRL